VLEQLGFDAKKEYLNIDLIVRDKKGRVYTIEIEVNNDKKNIEKNVEKVSFIKSKKHIHLFIGNKNYKKII